MWESSFTLQWANQTSMLHFGYPGFSFLMRTMKAYQAAIWVWHTWGCRLSDVVIQLVLFEVLRPSKPNGVNLHEMSKLSRHIFPKKGFLAFHVNCLHWRQFAQNVNQFQEKIFQYAIYWNFYSLLRLSNNGTLFSLEANEVCVEVLRPSQPNGIMSSVVSLPYHTFTGQV